MNTAQTLAIASTSSADTEKLGRHIGQKLRGGEVIELTSDLGGGKTTLVHGLASGAGSQDAVSSPTFTIAKEYKAPKFTVQHFDFYRLSDPGIVRNELAEVAGDPSNVTVIEWADVIADVLPAERAVIQIKLVPHDDNARSIHITYPEKYRYLFTGLHK